LQRKELPGIPGYKSTAKGHTLVIPKVEVDYIFDLDEKLYIG
jgi:diadenosine tetraphosphate (Ap4A) HIT family hydrolase